MIILNNPKNENKALNENEEQELDTTPVSEEVATEEAVETPVEVELTEETKPEVKVEETEEVPKKGAAKRIRTLNSQKNEAVKKAEKAEVKAESLADKLAALTGSVEPRAEIPPTQPQEDLGPIVKPGEEIDVNELDIRLRKRDANILRQAAAIAELKSKQGEAITRINSEAEDVVRKYPELDPKHESFNKELSETISEATDAYVSKSPYTASVSKFVDRLMKPYKGAVSKEVGKATKTIAKQVSGAALKPTSIRKGEKKASEKSIKQLEKDLGVVQV